MEERASRSETRATTSTATLNSRQTSLNVIKLYKDFRLVWLGNFVAQGGQWLQFLTIGWLVLKLTDGNAQVKFLQPMDVTKDEHIAELMDRCRSDLGQIDFLLHSIAFALPDDLKGDTIETSRDGFKLATSLLADEIFWSKRLQNLVQTLWRSLGGGGTSCATADYCLYDFESQCSTQHLNNCQCPPSPR